MAASQELLFGDNNEDDMSESLRKTLLLEVKEVDHVMLTLLAGAGR
jgi:hypothetical protein